MQVITYQSPRGNTIDITPAQVELLRSKGVWPRDYDGQEYCTVSHGLHRGESTYDDIELLDESR